MQGRAKCCHLLMDGEQSRLQNRYLSTPVMSVVTDERGVFSTRRDMGLLSVSTEPRMFFKNLD